MAVGSGLRRTARHCADEGNHQPRPRGTNRDGVSHSHVEGRSGTGVWRLFLNVSYRRAARIRAADVRDFPDRQRRSLAGSDGHSNLDMNTDRMLI